MMLRRLARNVIQTGVLATIWAISALVSRFWLTDVFVYRVFDMTSGTVYMHVSVSCVTRLSSEGEYLGDI
jgi:hypothetical protein